MENEELVNYEEMEPEVETESEDSGMSTGVAMMIGAGLAVAATAAIKLGKKIISKIKTKKEPEDGRDFVIPSDEELANVTK